MTTFELLTLAALLLALVGFLFPRGKKPYWTAFLPGLAALFALVHLVLDGCRWQMAPAYGLTVLLALWGVGASFSRNRASGTRIQFGTGMKM